VKTALDASYALGGISIGLQCDDPEVVALVDARFRPLRRPVAPPTDITIEIRGPGPAAGWLPPPAGAGRPIYDAPGQPIEYFDESDELYVDYGRRVRLLCSPSEGRISMAINGTDPGDSIQATHPMLTIALVETMKRFGRFSLHAAALSLDGRGVLVPGSSGSGKSTLTVTLVRAGFGFLSDDTVFLEPRTEGIWVSGFPDEVDVTDTTVSMVPELGPLADQPLRPGREKHGFRIEDVFDTTVVAGCRPVALVAPNLVAGVGPSLEPLAPGEALLQLMPNVLLTDPKASQAHLDVLGELARTIPCYSFSPGSDLPAAAACLHELLT
jgi:hypothetical protein